MNNEIPKNLETKIIWVLIGTNDFLRDDMDQCSDEVVLMGIRRVVDELMLQRPYSMIVVNSLLPRKNGKGKLYDKKNKTIQDAIDKLNSNLEVFCESHELLEYFDATDLFVRTNNSLGDGKESKYIPEALMKDHIHPTTQGYEDFGKKILTKLHELLDRKE